jgi:hypothetical protein
MAAGGIRAPNRSEAQHVMVGRHSIYNVQLVAGSGATRAFLLGQKKTWISRDISAFTHVSPATCGGMTIQPDRQTL